MQEGSSSINDCVATCRVPYITNGHTSFPEGSKVKDGAEVAVICNKGYLVTHATYVLLISIQSFLVTILVRERVRVSNILG